MPVLVSSRRRSYVRELQPFPVTGASLRSRRAGAGARGQQRERGGGRSPGSRRQGAGAKRPQPPGRGDSDDGGRSRPVLRHPGGKPSPTRRPGTMQCCTAARRSTRRNWRLLFSPHLHLLLVIPSVQRLIMMA
ncbi:uncharacterized protein LOC143693660 [Agelaius phoeniceus]|uniref:uncharacterized protein LOC143693660 n=1 Tax=Agelaius phoeniceus TaxID=39638 RepID=UPI004054F913